MSATNIVISYCLSTYIAFTFTVLLNNTSLGAYIAQIRHKITNQRHLSFSLLTYHSLNLNDMCKTFMFAKSKYLLYTDASTLYRLRLHLAAQIWKQCEPDHLHMWSGGSNHVLIASHFNRAFTVVFPFLDTDRILMPGVNGVSALFKFPSKTWQCVSEPETHYHNPETEAAISLQPSLVFVSTPVL